MRLIDADALIACEFKNDISFKALKNLVSRQPTIEAEPIKHGRWIALGDKSPWPAFHDDAVQCSACKFKYMRLMPRNYCPNCGAKMDEVGDDSQ